METMDGEKFFRAAVALTDMHPGTQFREMLARDSQCSQIERLYFRDEWRSLPICGYNTFCLKMEEAGQGKWLAKIKALDSDVILGHLEQQLMSASRDGKSPNRNLLEATVKALQGMTALTKIVADAENAGGANIPKIEVKFIGEAGDPITGYGPLPANAPDSPIEGPSLQSNGEAVEEE